MENKIKINYNGAKKNIVIMVTRIDKKKSQIFYEDYAHWKKRLKLRYKRDGSIENAVKKWTCNCQSYKKQIILEVIMYIIQIQIICTLSVHHSSCPINTVIH